ncbi:MAG: B12-binding domain-containing radical SAM protein, partial [Planctomycetota bacterium]
RTMLGSLWKNPKSIRYTGAMVALYLHFGPFSKYVANRIRTAIAEAEPAVRPKAKLAASG